MATKEEILKSKGEVWEYNTYQVTHVDDAYIAMEEYAKQQSINFLDWVEGNYSIAYIGFRITRERGEESYVWTNISGVRLTLPELYELYLLNKK